MYYLKCSLFLNFVVTEDSINNCDLISLCLAQGCRQNCQKLNVSICKAFTTLCSHPETCCFLRPKFTFAGGQKETKREHSGFSHCEVKCLLYYNCNYFVVHCYVQVLNFKSYVATKKRHQHFWKQWGKKQNVFLVNLHYISNYLSIYIFYA